MAAEQDKPPKTPGRTETASRRTKAPVTIDLEAEAKPPESGVADVPPESTASSSGESSSEAASPDQPDAGGSNPVAAAGPVQSSRLALGLAGFVGGLIALALGYGLQWAGVLPTPGRTEAVQALAETSDIKNIVSNVDQRVTTIEAASAQSIADRALLDDLSRQVGVVDAFGTSLSDRLLSAEASIAALDDGSGDNNAAVSQEMIDSLSDRIASLESAPPVSAGDTPTTLPDELSERIDALEAAQAEQATAAVPDVAAPAPTATEIAAKRDAAIAVLQRASARGGPFAADLSDAGDIEIAPSILAALMPLAEKDLPSRAALGAEFPSVADAMVAEEALPDGEAGIFDQVFSYGRSLVKIRPADPQTGDTVEAVVSRMRAAVAAGDFAGALSEREDLPAGEQAASEDWATATADRLEIERLIDEISAAPAAGASSG